MNKVHLNYCFVTYIFLHTSVDTHTGVGWKPRLKIGGRGFTFPASFSSLQFHFVIFILLPNSWSRAYGLLTETPDSLVSGFRPQ
jgi:hypothetical protein